MNSSFFALHRLQQVINSLCNLLIMNSAKKCHKTLQYTAPHNDFCSLQKPYIMNIVGYGVFFFPPLELSSSSVCRKERDFIFLLDVPLSIHIYYLCVGLLILLGDCCLLSSNWKNDIKIRHIRDKVLLYLFLLCSSLLQFFSFLPNFQFCFW